MGREVFIAADFGGGSGRIIAGSLRCDGSGEVELHEIHRFGNRVVKLGDTLYWDFPALFAELKEGLRKTVAAGYRIKSVGIDTWGVDFGLVDCSGRLLGNPICYRDNATAPYPSRFFADHDADEHYGRTGTQVMAINTLFRLMSLRDSSPGLLGAAEHLLFMPDLFAYYLTGNAVNEYTIASTSELLDARKREWDFALIRELGLPERIFGRIVYPGTVIGEIRADILDEIGAEEKIDVVAVGSHDTASAIHALSPDDGRQRAFLSSGTWSLLGAVTDEPVLTPKARAAGFTNEGIVDGKISFLQNITGLWMLQRLVEQWKKEGAVCDYPTLVEMASNSGCQTVIDVDDPAFATSFNISKAIRDYCSAHGLRAPESQGDFVMTVCRSLAERYRRGIEQLNSLLPRKVERLEIVGGGGRNRLLNKLTAEATGLEVTVGPAEATAIGNISVQVRAARDNKNE